MRPKYIKNRYGALSQECVDIPSNLPDSCLGEHLHWTCTDCGFTASGDCADLTEEQHRRDKEIRKTHLGITCGVGGKPRA
jgi:hypothetical protein